MKSRTGCLEQPVLITSLIHLNPYEVQLDSGQQ